jgi:hypothetical protein
MTSDKTMVEEMAQRFWAKVDRRSDDECWEWLARRAERGYGQYRHEGRTVRAHRHAWRLANGPIPSGLLVCHHCDNPPCCNPAHLFLGTDADNVHDMVSKGRNVRPPRDESSVNFPRGERCHAAKLTEGQVIEIRRRYDAGDKRMEMAREFGVDYTLIWQIGKRKAWKHVPEEMQHA